MHIILTGEKQVGKSTLVRSVLSETDRPIRGIKSVSFFENGDRVVYLFPAGIGTPNKEEGTKAGVCRNHHVVERHPEAFDTFGSALLSNLPSGSLVVIDEVGNMEKDAGLYSKAILDLLEREDLNVLCVVQKMAATPLANAIRGNHKAMLLDVTEENRNYIKETILEVLK